jgi:hypothetical protein
MSNNYILWVLKSLIIDCCLLILSGTVHGYIHVEGISTLKMEAEFSLKTRQNLQDYTVSCTDDGSLISNSTSLTTAYSEDT